MASMDIDTDVKPGANVRVQLSSRDPTLSYNHEPVVIPTSTCTSASFVVCQIDMCTSY
jgi:hypothetical protein